MQLNDNDNDNDNTNNSVKMTSNGSSSSLFDETLETMDLGDFGDFTDLTEENDLTELLDNPEITGITGITGTGNGFYTGMNENCNPGTKDPSFIKDLKGLNIKNNNICNNCSKHGHLFHQCKLPIISYGIIAFRHSSAGLQFLMIRRKDSFGYIDFIRGKYPSNNIEQLQNIINEMSINEKQQLLSQPFETLCKQMWGEHNMQYRSEEINSQKKFELLKHGITIDDEVHTLKSLIENSPTHWSETEWEFPKGRRNYQENDLDCALREFSEETGYLQSDISIVENVMPFEEIFIGSNYKSYKHKYYLAYMNTDQFINANTNVTSSATFITQQSSRVDNLQNFQRSEVSKIAWKTCEECIDLIRPYNLEKKQLIININKVLTDYILY
jgi:predicted NUDIX family NTP pyrophosphohydrolase